MGKSVTATSSLDTEILKIKKLISIKYQNGSEFLVCDTRLISSQLEIRVFFAPPNLFATAQSGMKRNKLKNYLIMTIAS